MYIAVTGKQDRRQDFPAVSESIEPCVYVWMHSTASYCATRKPVLPSDSADAARRERETDVSPADSVLRY